MAPRPSPLPPGVAGPAEDKFCAATGLTVDAFNNLLDFFNLGTVICNITFCDTSSRLSKSCDDIGSPKSSPKPKLSPRDQLFMYMTWLKNGFARSHLAWLFLKFRSQQLQGI